MKAINRPFTEIINGNRQFIIPVFQRDFSWTREQCEQLWRDVKRASAGEPDSGHFMGSIVYIGADLSSAFQSWLLIDGQQRLTTLTVLMIALRGGDSRAGYARPGSRSPDADGPPRADRGVRSDVEPAQWRLAGWPDQDRARSSCPTVRFRFTKSTVFHRTATPEGSSGALPSGRLRWGHRARIRDGTPQGRPLRSVAAVVRGRQPS